MRLYILNTFYILNDCQCSLHSWAERAKALLGADMNVTQLQFVWLLAIYMDTVKLSFKAIRMDSSSMLFSDMQIVCKGIIPLNLDSTIQCDCQDDFKILIHLGTPLTQQPEVGLGF